MTVRGIGLAWALRHAVLVAGALFMLAPFVWMVSASLKPAYEIASGSVTLLPQESWGAVENYTRALTAVPLLRFLANGALVCGAILAIQLAIAIPAAYALAKLPFPGRRLLFGGVLLGLLIPPQVPALPLYVGLYSVGLINTYAALILPFALSVFAIFLFRQFFLQIPDSLLEAARVDGYSETGICWAIVAPNAWPAIAAFSVFSVAAHWNDLFWPIIVISSTELAPPPLGIVFFRNEEAGSDYGALMAATVIVCAPVLALFVLAQRRFVEGITLTGLKG
ncbi:MAG: carbohydrate ABC transporter permease [Pseudomonadota bacterium]